MHTALNNRTQGPEQRPRGPPLQVVGIGRGGRRSEWHKWVSGCRPHRWGSQGWGSSGGSAGAGRKSASPTFEKGEMEPAVPCGDLHASAVSPEVPEWAPRMEEGTGRGWDQDPVEGVPWAGAGVCVPAGAPWSPRSPLHGVGAHRSPARAEHRHPAARRPGRLPLCSLQMH